jgi:hypothetical protein
MDAHALQPPVTQTATQPCARCGRVVPIQALVYDGDAQLICTSCEGDAEMDAASRKNIIQTMVVPPVLALTGTVMFCVPIVGIFVPFFCGLVALLGGVQSIRMGMSLDNAGVTPSNQPLLVISGIFSALWALAIMGFEALAWFGLAIGM